MPSEYSGGKWVVLIISGAKLFKMYLGINGEIIINSKYYKILLPIGIGMALSVAFLNDILIDMYSTNGAAISTLIVVIFFSCMKLWYVNYKFSMTPHSNKTNQLLLLLVVIFVSFYFWNFLFHPIINIVLNTFLIGFVYFLIALKLKISPEINNLISRIVKI